MSPPKHHIRLLVFTFLGSFATILMQRGLYFFTDERLHFTPVQNLWMAVLFGASYTIGALVSHPVTHRFGEKRILSGLLVGLIVVHAVLGLAHHGGVLVSCFGLVGLLVGAKWPIVESYVNAGRSEEQTLKSVGRFNLAWASSIPAALGSVGPILDSPAPASIFWLAMGLNIIGLLLILPLPARPPHLPHDHPHRPDALTKRRYEALLSAARWTMLSSYILMFLIAPLMPTIFTRLQVHIDWAPAASSLLDVLRLTAFFVLGVWTAWHGKALPLVLAAVASPVGFAMVLFGGNLATVLLGEVIFGAAAGMCYYAALYYAMVVKNASVDAGGVHESLIGAGLGIGPLIGLLGYGLADALGGYTAGMTLGVGPFIALCLVLALRPLVKMNASPR